jgi:protein TonB
MKDPRFWLAFLLSGSLHGLTGAAIVAITFFHVGHFEPPIALLEYGDSGVNGMPIDVVSENSGTTVRGPEIPAPPGAPPPEAAEKRPDEKPPPPEKADPTADKAPEPAASLDLADDMPVARPREMPATADRPMVTPAPSLNTAGGIISSVAASSSRLPLGTPSAGGKLGSVTGVSRVGGGKAPYPLEALQRRMEGQVMVLIRVSEKGTVAEAKLEKSSGYAILDQAAVSYCENLRFLPAKRDGVPVESTWLYPVTYELTAQ